MVERRIPPGYVPMDPLDASRHSPLLRGGLDKSRPDPGEPGPPPTWRPLAGASANNRGQGRLVTLDTLNPAEQHIPSIVQSPRGEGNFDGELISVRLGLFLPPQLPVVIPVDVVCLLDFGVGGVSYTAEVDWNQGTVFGVSASFVRVSARIGALPNVPAAAVDITLQASLAYGDASNSGLSAEARRTLNVGDVAGLVKSLPAGGTSAVFPIPLWAVGFTLVDAGTFPGNLPVAPDYTITLFDDSTTISTIFKYVDRTNVANQIEGQFPVPVGARFVSVTNNLGVAMRSPRLIFNLSL